MCVMFTGLSKSITLILQLYFCSTTFWVWYYRNVRRLFLSVPNQINHQLILKYSQIHNSVMLKNNNKLGYTMASKSSKTGTTIINKQITNVLDIETILIFFNNDQIIIISSQFLLCRLQVYHYQRGSLFSI